MATTTHIQFGNGLVVTDEGGGVIRVDGTGGVPGATGPQGPAGPAGPAGPNLIDGSTPTPLTGLLKGNGTDIDVATAADVPLPNRIREEGGYAYITDYNAATQNGWYWAASGSANGPPSNDHAELAVLNLDANAVRQISYQYATDLIYMRRRTAGTWQPWTTVASTIGDNAWQLLSFASGNWSNFGSTHVPLRARRVASGIVLLQGLVNNSASPTSTITVLPAGFRPGYTLILSQMADSGPTRVDIDSAGNVSAPTWAPAAGTHWLSLTGITLYAEG